MNLFHSSIDVGKCNDQEQNFFVAVFKYPIEKLSRHHCVFHKRRNNERYSYENLRWPFGDRTVVSKNGR